MIERNTDLTDWTDKNGLCSLREHGVFPFVNFACIFFAFPAGRQVCGKIQRPAGPLKPRTVQLLSIRINRLFDIDEGYLHTSPHIGSGF